MKKDAFYFQHDYNASSDVKILFMRQQLGMEGYGIYWFLLEQLANAGGNLPLKIVPVLAMQMQVQDVKVMAVIKQFDLFVVDESQNFFSLRLNKHLEIRKQLSEEGKRGAKIRWSNREAIAPPNGEGNAKERKGKEIKEIYIGEVSDFWIAIKPTYVHDSPIRIFDLQKFYEENGKIDALLVKRWNRFKDFVSENSGRVFNDENHLYNSFRQFHQKTEAPKTNYKIQ